MDSPFDHPVWGETRGWVCLPPVHRSVRGAEQYNIRAVPDQPRRRQAPGMEGKAHAVRYRDPFRSRAPDAVNLNVPNVSVRTVDIADLLRDPRNGGRVVMAFSRSIFSSFMIHQEPVIPR